MFLLKSFVIYAASSLLRVFAAPVDVRTASFSRSTGMPHGQFVSA
jgi:hypothetical protein